MELAIRTATPYPLPKRAWESHPVYLYTNDPSLADVDERGFRITGAATIDKLDITAVGNSFIYGYNVAAKDS